MTIAQTAQKIAEAGFATFPLNMDGTPRTGNGFKDASLDPFYTEERFAKYGDNVRIGIATGMSGLVVLDLDYKQAPDGTVLVDGFDSLDKAWEDVPASYSYTSAGGHGKHIWYAAPEGKHLARKIGYRKMQGVDRCSGDGYVVFAGDTIPDKSALAPAPEWLCDETQARTVSTYEGTVKEWYDRLEEGEPSLLVRRALEDAERLYSDRGDDFNHSDVIELQHRAIRLGAEGNPGVPALLERIEEMFLSRTGAHSRPEEEWAYEFAEGLASGISKHGDAIDLWKNLPDFDVTKVPSSVPDRLLVGEPGMKATFSELLRELQTASDDDLYVTSVLWNAPRTRDLAHEWGLEFVHSRVVSARQSPEPVRENPTIPVAEPQKEAITSTGTGFLTTAEQDTVDGIHTFIDSYIEGTNTKGFTNRTYAVPAAWTCLSMAFGRRAFIPLAKTLEVNIWFTVLGESTTGKGTEDRFLRAVLNTMFLDGESENYNLGALSSPDGLHLGLINRDGLPSIIHNDEASDFFRDIKVKDWMASVPDKLAKWFDGFIEPSSKISLKDARGKSAHTSLNQLMWGTPDRLLSLLDATQFESGYLARVNWVWDGTIPDPDRKSDLKLQEGRTSETPEAVFELALDLKHAAWILGDRYAVGGTEEAQDRLNQAADDFRARARQSIRWSFVKPAVDRLVMETLWKCAALLALYRGERTFLIEDALVAISYASEWLETLLSVSESISESPYSRDLEEMESFIRNQGGSVSRALLLHSFRGKVLRTGRELEDRIGFLLDSGRILRKTGKDNNEIVYSING